MIVIVTMTIVMIMIACWSEHLQYGTRGHRSYNINNADCRSWATHVFFWWNNWFCRPNCSFSIPRTRLLQDPVVAGLSHTRSHSRHEDTQHRHTSPSSKAVSLQLRFIKAARSTCLQLRTNSLVDQPEQRLLEHHPPGLWKSSYSTWNQTSWEYVHSTTIQE